jgi:hypothetical protein
LLELPVIEVGLVTLSSRTLIRVWHEQVRNVPEGWTYDQVLLRGASNVRVDGVCLVQAHSTRRRARVDHTRFAEFGEVRTRAALTQFS